MTAARRCYDSHMPRKPTKKTYRLRYQPPYDFPALLTFFGKRAIPSVERIDEKSYVRDFAHRRQSRTSARRTRRGDALKLTIDFPDVARHAEIAAHVRRMFDTDADIATINASLAKRRHLKKCIRLNPGQRLPGGWDVFEFAIRAVLGQQISVAAARTFTRASRRAIRKIRDRRRRQTDQSVSRTATRSPMPISPSIGVVRARAAAINGIARAVRDGIVSIDRDQPLDDFVASWTQLQGIGDWTAHYIAMRALSHSNAFPAADLVLRRAVARDGKPVPLRELYAIAEAWQPWRAYAVLHLWRVAP